MTSIHRRMHATKIWPLPNEKIPAKIPQHAIIHYNNYYNGRRDYVTFLLRDVYLWYVYVFRKY